MRYGRPSFARRSIRIYTTLACLIACISIPAGPAGQPGEEHAQAQALGGLPLVFEPNIGLADVGVRFLAHGSGIGISFAPDEIAFTLPSSSLGQEGGNEAQQAAPSPQVARLHFLNANPMPSMVAGRLLPGWTNHFQGNDPSQWHTHVPTYAGIIYQGLYPGVDLAYSGEGSHLKSTYTIAPGVDPALIRWRHEETTSVQVDQTGNLKVEYSAGITGGTNQEAGVGGNEYSEYSVPSRQSLFLTEEAPVAWQEIGGQRVVVPAHYVVDHAGTIGFALGRYDTAQPLTIDPTLIYSTFFGGIGEEAGYGIAVDPVGNIYLTGYTSSSHTFPPEHSLLEGGRGYWDAFVTKLSADGQKMIFSTYLSGTDWDVANGIAVDGAGNIYVGGETASRDFPLRNAYQSHYGGGLYDAFVTEFNSLGELVYSTYLGGSGLDRGRGLVLDKSGKVAITGYTDSTDFPLAKPIQSKYGGGFNDAFVAKLDASNSTLVYSTFLGGSGTDYGWNLATDEAGNVVVTGYTSSSDFPLQHPYQARSGGGTHDVFVSKLAADGSALIYSTYLGGNAEDLGRAVATDAAGNTYVTGSTTSSDFPTANALQPRRTGDNSAVFVTKLDAGGSALVYSTYIGGSASGVPGDEGLAIAVDAAGSAYVAGATGSTGFPLARPLQPALGGRVDAFLAKINAAGSALDYSTYLGGAEEDHPFALAVDRGGNVYITGETHSSNFPTARPFQGDRFGSGDIFIAEISDSPDSAITPEVIRTPATVPTYIYITEDDDDVAGPVGSSTIAATPGGPANETETAMPPVGNSLSVTPSIATSPTPSGIADPQTDQTQPLIWLLLLIGLGAGTAIVIKMLQLRRAPRNEDL